MIIIKSRTLPALLPPKPQNFLGTDADWFTLNNIDTNQDQIPDWQQKEEPEITFDPFPPEAAKPKALVEPISTEPAPVEPAPVEPIPATPAPATPPEDIQVPDWLGKEIPEEVPEIEPPPPPVSPETPLPVSSPEDIPTGVSREGPPSEYQEFLDDQGFQKIEPKKEEEPVDPAKMFEEVLPEDTPLEQRNKQMDIRQKIWYSLHSGEKLKINYDTLEKPDKPSLNVTRLVIPQYVAFHDGTNQFFLYTKPDPMNVGRYGPLDSGNPDGWKSFAIDNIRSADLEE
jgi:hypothetical protein